MDMDVGKKMGDVDKDKICWIWMYVDAEEAK